MADYWKSQPRKFCELCKCWITDNKPSRDFHERGKRHQQSVKNKLNELKKKGVKDAKQKRENEAYIQKMETDAMKKFQQDIADNPHLAKQYAGDLDALTSQQKDKIKLEKTLKNIVQKKQNALDPGDWQEGYTEEGYVYYWNNKTGESSWYPPNNVEHTKTETESKIDVKDIQLTTPVTEMQNKKKEEKKRENKVDNTSENSKKRKIEKEKDEKLQPLKPKNTTGFGSWTPVVQQTETYIDAQLPVVKDKPLPVRPAEDAFEPFEITEKTAILPLERIKNNPFKMEIGKKISKEKNEIKSEVKKEFENEVKDEKVTVVKKVKRNIRAKDDS